MSEPEEWLRFPEDGGRIRCAKCQTWVGWGGVGGVFLRKEVPFDSKVLDDTQAGTRLTM